ncbi:MAG: hypothetical protein LBT21_07725 [Oscillospiraceae bacterium]|jgi:hypothetical protein|nr:hypothetical protein [Oscillospiraceae bacterium]
MSKSKKAQILLIAVVACLTIVSLCFALPGDAVDPPPPEPWVDNTGDITDPPYYDDEDADGEEETDDDADATEPNWSENLPLLDESKSEYVTLPAAMRYGAGWFSVDALEGKKLLGNIYGDDQAGLNGYSAETGGNASFDIETGKLTMLPNTVETQSDLSDYPILSDTVVQLSDGWSYAWYGKYVDGVPTEQGGYPSANLEPFFAKVNPKTGKSEVLLRRDVGSMSYGTFIAAVSDDELVFAYTTMENVKTVVTTVEKYSVKTKKFTVILSEKGTIKSGETYVQGVTVTNITSFGGRIYLLARTRKNFEETVKIRAYNADGKLWRSWKISNVSEIFSGSYNGTYRFEVFGETLITDNGYFSLSTDSVKKIGDTRVYFFDGLGYRSSCVSGSFEYYVLDYYISIICAVDLNTGKIKALRLPLDRDDIRMYFDSDGNVAFASDNEADTTEKRHLEVIWVSAKNIEAAFKAAPEIG